MNKNKSAIPARAHVINCTRATGGTTSVHIKRALYEFLCGVFGRQDTNIKVRELFLRFNNGMGGAGVSTFVAEALAISSAAFVASRLRQMVPNAVLPSGLTEACDIQVVRSGALSAPTIDLDDPAIQLLTEPRVVGRQTYAGYTVTWEVMPWSMFSSLPECKYQRHTESRAAKARKGHLKKESPMHLQVAATRLAGKLEMLDSHTRTMLQKQYALKPPCALMCLVVHCNSLEDIKRFYDQVDNVVAAEQPKEKVAGTWRSLNYLPQTDFVVNKAKTALQLGMYGDTTTREPRALAEAALPFIRPLDRDGRGLTKARPPVVGAAVTAVRKCYQDGEPGLVAEVSDFLERFEKADQKIKSLKEALRKKGMTIAGSMSPPTQAEPAELVAWTLATQETMTGMQGQQTAYGYALGALRMWLENPRAVHEVSDLCPLDMQTFMSLSAFGTSKTAVTYANGTSRTAMLTVGFSPVPSTHQASEEDAADWYASLIQSGQVGAIGPTQGMMA